MLLWDMERIRARESLVFMMNIGAILAGEKGREYIAEVAQQAFVGDEWSYMKFLQALDAGG